MPTDPRTDAYIEKQAEFAKPILRHIRARMHAACPEVVETVKWRRPFFDYKGHPLAIMSGFKAHASFGFWRRDAVTTGQEGEAMGQFGRLTSIADLPGDAEFDEMIRAAAAIIANGSGKPSARRPRQSASPRRSACCVRAKGGTGNMRSEGSRRTVAR